MPSRSDKDKVVAVSLCVAAALSMLIVLENFPHKLVAEVRPLGFPELLYSTWVFIPVPFSCVGLLHRY